MAHGTNRDTAEIYSPILEDLQQVEKRLSQLQIGAPADVQDLIEHILSSGGKRVRPAVTLLAARCYGVETEWAVTMAAAIELLHIATLVHDDTVDDAETRRGKATVSNVWGKNIAVLFGDYVFATSATSCKFLQTVPAGLLGEFINSNKFFSFMFFILFSNNSAVGNQLELLVV